MAWTTEQLLATVNYDEAKVPAYTLPDALVGLDGAKVTSAQQWQNKRRPEVLGLFEKYVYGRVFPVRTPVARVVEKDANALCGKATRLQVALTFAGMPGVELNLLVYLPNKVFKAPCFLGLNYFGNFGSTNDPAILITPGWVRDSAHSRNHRATQATRGVEAHRWPAEQIIDRGYAMATMHYADLDPDFDDGFKNGVHPFLVGHEGPRKPDDAGAITAWAWGLSRAMDYLLTLTEVDGRRVCLTGHSRLGKTALWAGATDERFALVVSNNAGCGGPALNRRTIGETMFILTNIQTHWFCEKAREMSDKVDQLPLDQHMLLGLIAPRPVFISSAQEDIWADPKGEFLGGLHADSVYRLLTGEGCDLKEMPGINQPMMSRIGYYIRPGKHDITPDDWKVHMDFADKHLK